MNPRAFGVGAVILTLVGVLVGLSIFGGDRNTQAQPALRIVEVEKALGPDRPEGRRGLRSFADASRASAEWLGRSGLVFHR